MSAFPALDAQHHALAVDVATFSCKQLAAAQARAVERHQHRAVIEILRAGNQATDFVGTQDGGKPSMALRGRELLLQLAPLEHPDKEEAQGRDMEAHGPHGQLLLFKQMRLIAPERVRAELIESAGRGGSARRCGARAGRCESWSASNCAGPFPRAGIAGMSSQVVPPVTHPTPFVLRITRLPVGRRASGFVLVAKCRAMIGRAVESSEPRWSGPFDSGRE